MRPAHVMEGPNIMPNRPEWLYSIAGAMVKSSDAGFVGGEPPLDPEKRFLL